MDDIYKNRSVFKTEVKVATQEGLLYTGIATKVVATADRINTPTLEVSPAKNSTKRCLNPVATKTWTTKQLDLTRMVSTVLPFCVAEEELFNYDETETYRAGVIESVREKLNANFMKDMKDGAIEENPITDLSDSTSVIKFLNRVNMLASNNKIINHKRVENGKVTKAYLHNKPFVIVGENVFTQIQNTVMLTVSAFSDKGVQGKTYDTPFGVTIINFGNAATDPNDIIYGVSGVPIAASREDRVEYKIGEITSYVLATEDDLEVLTGDQMLSSTHYVKAGIVANNGILTNKELVFRSTMSTP